MDNKTIATVYNAIPNTPFENFYATDDLLITLLEQEGIYNDNIVVISPDEGAMNRARVFADILGHADISSTQIYAQIVNNRFKDTYNRCHPRARSV